ncbi:MAG: aldo/keto reductase [Pseudomonadota bacterium]
MNKLPLAGIDQPITRIGLGCMGMSEFYGAPSSEADAHGVMARAVELGINFFDTADMYGSGHNERLIGSFLKGRRDDVIIATKGAIRREADGSRGGIDTSPDYVRQACEASLQRLGVDAIDLYYMHRLDGVTPIEDTMEALAGLVADGKIRAIGLSEVSAATLKRAHAVHPVAALQSEYSLTTRDPENGVLQACADLGTAFVAYSPLGRGILAGAVTRDTVFEPGDVRATPFFPRFTGEALQANVALADRVADIAAELGATTGQVALAWLLSKPGVVPIPGTRRISRLEENAGALSLSLSADQIAALEAAIPPDAIQGDRYGEGGMQALGR